MKKLIVTILVIFVICTSIMADTQSETTKKLKICEQALYECGQQHDKSLGELHEAEKQVEALKGKLETAKGKDDRVLWINSRFLSGGVVTIGAVALATINPSLGVLGFLTASIIWGG